MHYEFEYEVVVILLTRSTLYLGCDGIFYFCSMLSYDLRIKFPTITSLGLAYCVTWNVRIYYIAYNFAIATPRSYNSVVNINFARLSNSELITGVSIDVELVGSACRTCIA